MIIQNNVRIDIARSTSLLYVHLVNVIYIYENKLISNELRMKSDLY